MTTDLRDLNSKVWSTIHSTHCALKRCEDKLFEERGLTTEQYSALVAINSLNGNARVTDVAHLVERSVNSVTMIIDRMVKAGLVRRTRSRRDRRTVNVVITDKAGVLLKPAVEAGRVFINEILASTPDDDKRMLISLLEAIRNEAQNSGQAHE